MSPLFVSGSRGPSYGYVITNASRKNDLMVASYPCNEGGMLDMCVIGATSHEVGQALRSHINGYKRFVTPFSRKCQGDHQDPSPEKDNIRYRNYVITNIQICIFITHIRSNTYTCDHICVY